MKRFHLWILFLMASCAVCQSCSEQDKTEYISLLMADIPSNQSKHQLQLIIKKAAQLSQSCEGPVFRGLIKNEYCETALQYSIEAFKQQKSSSDLDAYYRIYAKVFQNISLKCKENDLPTIKSGPPRTYDDESYIFGQVKGNPIQCVLAISPLKPLFRNLIQDVKAHASFNTISADLTSIFSRIDGVCSACNIPQPKTPLGPINVQECLIDGVNIAGYAVNIVKAEGDKAQIIRAITNILAIAPKALQDCGIQIPSH